MRQLKADAKLREWENNKRTIEPKLPGIKRQVFFEPPLEHKLTDKTLEFYEARLDEAMKSLFHPPLKE
jgi:hypothetical protein